MPVSRPYSFLGKVALAGVGYTEFSKQSGRSILSLATEAARKALDDAGLDRATVNGMASYSWYGDSVPTTAVATALGLPQLDWAIDLATGGMAPSFAVMNAAMAIDAGVADAVVIYRALNGRSGLRVGSMRFPAPTAQYRYPLGLSAYPQYMAMIARRYFIDTDSDESDLLAVVQAQRTYAALNERAMIRRPISDEEYYGTPYIADPLRRWDCTTEVDGACAVVLTSLERARDLRTTPVVVQGAAWSTSAGAGLDMADLNSYKDYGHISQVEVGRRLWESTGMTPDDIDVAELYDCFSSKVLLGLEALGFAERGGAGDLIKSGATRLGGRIPVNTHGGLLSEGYLHGMNTLGEAFEQLQGRSGARQVEGARRAVVTSGGFVETSGLILEKAA
jgi:acetyl-CoA acetyltransferase